MVSRNLLVGISMLAFAAGTAGAQTTVVTGSNTSTTTASGVGNSAGPASQTGEENTATFVVVGDNNVAIATQNGFFNRSEIEQRGSNNRARHVQNGSRNFARTSQVNNNHDSEIRQNGTRNSATVNQSNSASTAGNMSTVLQGVTETTVGTPSADNPRTFTNNATQAADNTLTVNMTGRSGTSIVRQNGNFNSATVTTRGRFSQNDLTQSSNENRASILVGNTDSDGSILANNSTLTQRNINAAGDAPLTTTAGGNTAFIGIIGNGNRSRADQNGALNTVDVSMLGGGGGNAANPDADVVNNPFAGNRSDINQTGTRNVANVALGFTNGVAARGNITFIDQTATRARADSWQRGQLDQADIDQTQGTSPTTAFSDGSFAQAFASVSQAGTRTLATPRVLSADGTQVVTPAQNFAFRAKVDQRGDNFAEVTQGFGGEQSVTTIDQTDAGDTTTRTGPFAGDTTTTRARNQGRVSQNGVRQIATIRQNAVAAGADIFQRVGSSQNFALVEQGLGQDAQTLGTTTGGTEAGAGGAATQRVSASITQGGTLNSATVRQNGVDLTAVVIQEGRGTRTLSDGTTTVQPNLVTIQQVGTGSFARAIQTENVGPSAGSSGATGAGLEFGRAAGSQSAEARIFQSGTGHFADIRQEGKGQFAMIEQSNTNNSASIRQGAAATNAVGVIRQSGTGNSFFINQTAPNQFMVVTQTGTGNTATNVVQAGPTQ